MANIGILMKNLQVGGAQKQSMLLAQVLKKKHKLTFIVFNGNRISDRFQSLANDFGINHYILKGNLFFRLINFYGICRVNKVEILFSYLAGDNVIGATLGRMAGIKYLIGGIRSSKIKYYKLIVQRFLTNRFFCFIVFNNQTGLNAMIDKGFPRNKCVLIENSIEINQKPLTRSKKELVKIITVSRFEEMKDFLTAIKAIRLILNRKMIPSNMMIVYEIIGKGSQTDYIDKWIHYYNMQNNIKIIKEPLDIEKHFLDADIYLSTSLFEGISNSIMEALLFSLPVVATDVGDNFRLVQNGFNGFLVPAKDSVIISNKLEYLINEYTKRIEFGLNGYSLLKERFSIKRFEEAYQGLLSQLESNI